MLMLIDIPVLWQYLALLGAVLVLLILDMFYSAFRHRSLSDFWSEEHYFLFPWGGNLRQHMGTFFLLSAIFFYAVKTMLRSCTLYQAEWTGPEGTFDHFAESFYDISLILALIKLLLFSRFSWKQFFLCSLFLTPFFISHIITQDPSYFLEFLLILCAKGEDLRKLLKYLLSTLLLCTAGIFTLYFNGLIPVDSTGGALVEEVRHRFALGFIHPNIFSLYVAALNWGWLLLRWHKIRWWDWLCIAFLNAGVYYLTDSRSMFLCVAASELIALILHRFPRLFRFSIWAWLAALVPPVLAALTLLPCYYYDPSSPLWSKINRLFSTRPALFFDYWQNSGWSVWGMDASSGDSIFLFMQIERGAICWILFILAYSALLFMLCKNHCWAEFTVCLGLLFICFTEKTPLAITVNLTFWMLSNLLCLLPWSRWTRFSIPREQD